MYNFSPKSKERLYTCTPELVYVMEETIKVSPVDFAITCGFRNEVDQMIAFQEGKSTKQWPDSKHNSNPSIAVDFVPIVDGKARWDYPHLFFLIAGIAIGFSMAKGFTLRWGGAWKGTLNQKGEFQDLPHLEVVNGIS